MSKTKHETKHYVDDKGVYLGGYGDGAVPPAGAIQVDEAPEFASDIWTGNKWEADLVEKDKRDKKKLVKDESDALFDALLDLLPAEYADRVAAYRAAKV